MLRLLLKSWKEIALIIALASLYYTIYNMGVTHEKQNTVKILQKIADDNQKQIEILESNISKYVEMSNTATIKTSANLDKIANDVKSKPMTIIKNGNCIPSDDFKNSFGKLISEGNSK